MLNRLTQLANMIGNLNILQPFQNNQNPTSASEVAKQYNEEQDLIRNEMGKMDDTSAEYQQLASLLRESEQEEQEAVSALTYENQSEEYKTASSAVDDVIDKLSTFAQDDSDLSSLLDERTGIIKNIVAKENELKNAKDEDEIQKIKDEIEKLYEEKAKKEENIYDYIKENPKYESVSTNLKSAIDSLKEVRGTKEIKKETDAAGDGGSGGGGGTDLSTTSNNGNDQKDTQELQFVGIADIKPVNFDITVDYNGASIDLSVDFSKLTNYPLEQLSVIKDQYASAAINYENNYESCNEAITTLNGNTQALTKALDSIANKDIELTAEESKLVDTTKELAKSIDTTTKDIAKYDDSITKLTSETIDLRNERDSLVYPAPPSQPVSSEEGEEGEKAQSAYDEAKAAYDTAVAEIDGRKQQLSETITKNEAKIDETRKQKDEAEEKLKKDCEELDKNTKCLLENQKFQEVLSGYKENYIDKKQETTTLASAYIDASDKYETDLTQIYANMKAIDDQIATRLAVADEALHKGSDSPNGMDEDSLERYNSFLSALSWAQNYLNSTNDKKREEDDGVAGKKAAIDSFVNGMMTDADPELISNLAGCPAENVAQYIIDQYYRDYLNVKEG